MRGWKSFRRLLAVALWGLAISCTPSTASDTQGPWSSLRDKVVPLKEKYYDDLPPKGKLATGAVVGLTSSRLAAKAIMGVVKAAGATFVAAEVLNYAGVFDEVSDETAERARDLKQSAFRAVQEFRVAVRREFNPDTLKETVEKEKSAATGFAAGAFLGFIL